MKMTRVMNRGIMFTSITVGDNHGKNVCKDSVYRSRCDHRQIDNRDWIGDDIRAGMLDNATTRLAETRSICLFCDQRIFTLSF